MALPRSALLATWLTAVLRGHAGPDELADAVHGADPRHLVVGWPGEAEPFGLALLPGAVRRAGTVAVHLAAPVPGDPVGLAGPPEFNTEVLGAGEAVLLAGGAGAASYGLVPEVDARTVLWQVAAANPPVPLDPGEAGRVLRRTLVETTAALVRLDVASWQPEIPDLLLNVRHRDPLHLPPGTPPEVLDTLERADLCRDIVALALGVDGGTVSAYEAEERRRCLTDLDRSARRAIAACCSASLVST
ncbi:MAG: hypothetical protein J7518_05525 [Nocardioidaceae bacterium]|nr:hypothetical protein [Nocardioidaceae bacterium]